MTKTEFKAFRSEYKRMIKSAFEEYQYYSGDRFNPDNEKANDAYYRYWRLVERFAYMINCHPVKAARMFNVKGV